MTKENIAAAVELAKEFLKKAKAYQQAVSVTYSYEEHTYHNSAPKESGALRRSSMELTRSLAEMRRP